MASQGQIGTQKNGSKLYHLDYDPERIPQYLPDPSR